ncbi:MAG TPA: sporulation protein YqfD [Tissierellaceae bacterium]|nr:sporulation protein YqfD [Tissierellaceae bacterium]
MLAIKIWNYLKGYVIIRIKGLSLERLLNLALVKDIYLWDVKRVSNYEIEATVSLVGVKALDKLVERLGCQVKIVERRGLPFLLDRLRKRKMLGLGVIVFIILIGLLSSLVWQIEIIGTEQIPQMEILKLLEENNIKTGRFKKDIDKDQVERLILDKFQYISFLDIRKTGVKLIIELKEQDMPPEKADKSYPANVVAKKKGVILKIVAIKGKAVVNKGDVVNPGDILISGIMDSELSDEVYLVHAEGEILAQARYTATVESPIIKYEERETGKTYKQRGIKFKDKGIKFFAGEIPFENYKEEVKEISLLRFDRLNIKLPIKLIYYTYRETELEEIKQNIDFLKKSTQLEAIEKINKELSEESEILSKDSIFNIEDNILKTQVIIETIEDIGKVQIISQ